MVNNKVHYKNSTTDMKILNINYD